MLPIRMLDFIDSNIAQTLTSWTYFLHFPITGRVVRAFSGVFYTGSNKCKKTQMLSFRKCEERPLHSLFLAMLTGQLRGHKDVCIYLDIMAKPTFKKPVYKGYQVT